MKLLLTGASGVVGSALYTALKAAGLDVTTLPHSELAKPLPGAPHTVIHAAWEGSAGPERNDESLLARNMDMSMKLLEAARAAGAKRWISFGSQAEYSPNLQDPIAESAPTEPATAYGKAKLRLCSMQQKFCAAHDMEFFWLRLFTCTSVRQQPPYLIPTLVGALHTGALPQLNTPHAVEDLLHAEDMANAVVKILGTEGKGGVYNLASGVGVSVAEIARILTRHMHPTLMEKLETAIASTALPDTRRVADIGRITGALGWKPSIGLEENLIRMAHAATHMGA
ncbi:MAG: NAD-dependent epimerase/dehydratase family protein [Alphaproteobacteria bacterium]|nr:NAD-dependent epimerase/dehydratase family protein [Alphaproteobacteria bacterium]